MSDDNGEKLYAGKFKSIEELEAGYNNAAKVYQENDDLKKKYDDITRVPESYAVPQGIDLHDSDVNELKEQAKHSGLTQSQFDKLAFNQNEKVRSKFESYEKSKKEIGADNLNLLQDFLKSSYPEKVAEKLLNEAIKDKNIRDQLLDQRTKALNSSVPGIGRVSVSNYQHVTNDDIVKARDVMLKSRGKARIEAQNRYIALSAQKAHANDGA